MSELEKKPTKKQIASMKGFIHEWTSIGLITDDKYTKEKYPHAYEAAARIELEQVVIDAACDDMRSRLPK